MAVNRHGACQVEKTRKNQAQKHGIRKSGKLNKKERKHGDEIEEKMATKEEIRKTKKIINDI